MLGIQSKYLQSEEWLVILWNWASLVCWMTMLRKCYITRNFLWYPTFLGIFGFWASRPTGLLQKLIHCLILIIYLRFKARFLRLFAVNTFKNLKMGNFSDNLHFEEEACFRLTMPVPQIVGLHWNEFQQSKEFPYFSYKLRNRLYSNQTLIPRIAWFTFYKNPTMFGI